MCKNLRLNVICCRVIHVDVRDRRHVSVGGKGERRKDVEPRCYLPDCQLKWNSGIILASFANEIRPFYKQVCRQTHNAEHIQTGVSLGSAQNPRREE